MREIKFRGKRIDTGEWIEGYLFKSWNQAYILWGVTNGIPDMIKVDPKTVGQYIEKKDKNGKEIYEGDIVRGHLTITGEVFHVKGVVVYEPCSFVCKHTLDSEITYFNLDYYDLEVIGNIHENPELLER